ncbi:sec-independent protein translocase protein TATA, chloroplastic-like [Papaver somniferum]|uniref:sec-independent protein translocase protein TATA, chloroplastic-like n=1 Tax=Papaver somniferum TaxID=3469 RepID=UPI000E6FFB43|nr:sec-independent protein translocase protein TATA, chloroplastic-like [Papaver somniferum]
MEISLTLSSPNISITRLSSPPSSSLKICSRNSVFFNNGSRSLFMMKNTNCMVLSRNNNNGQAGMNVKCLFGLGVPELAVIAGVVALVFGPKKLPEVGRSIGKTVKSFQQAAKEFETELKKDPEPLKEEEAPAEKPKAVSEIVDEKQDNKIPSSTEKNL